MERPIRDLSEKASGAVPPELSPSADQTRQIDEQGHPEPASQPTAGRRSAMFWVAVVVSVLVALAGLIALGILPRLEKRNQLVEHTKEQTAALPTVSVVLAQRSPAIEEFSLPGSTQAIQDAPIYARVDGYLKQRYVNIGDHVHKGQILADIDTPELDKQVQAAESAVEQADANLDTAKQSLEKAVADNRSAVANVAKAKTDLQFFETELGRYKLLAKQGAVSLEDRDSRVQAYNGGMATLDALTATERASNANVNSARAAVHVAQAAVDRARAQAQQYEATRSFKKVTAPFDGIVTRRNVDAGALITSGSNSNNTLLFEIAKTDVLRVFVYAPEQFVPYMHEKEQAKLNFQEYARRDFVGEVTNVSGGVDPQSRTLEVEIHVPNPDHLLMPGMYASVKFQAPAQVRLPIVPATTLQTRADGAFIYTVDSTEHVHMHKVEIARDFGGQFEVSRGIAIGDQVIVSPSDNIVEGMSVKAIQAPGQASPNSNKTAARD
ncbi:MAG TPA: efflux RND transporter periplasmic adaptor subunit [Chroococcales cyanobacterium]